MTVPSCPAETYPPPLALLGAHACDLAKAASQTTQGGATHLDRWQKESG